MFKKVALFFLVFMLFSSSFAATVQIGANKEFIANGRQFFPVFALNQPAELLVYQRSFGVNIFITEKEQKKGMTVEKYLSEVKAVKAFAVLGYEWLKETNKLGLLNTEPALIGCLIANEPDTQVSGNPRLSADELEKRCKEVKAVAPGSITWLNLSSGFFNEENADRSKLVYYKKAAGFPEVLSFGIYPINMWGKNTVGAGAAVKQLRGLCGDRVPVLACLEATVLPAVNKEGRAPAAGEVTVEVWSSLINGAKGLGYLLEQKAGPSKKTVKLDPVIEGFFGQTHAMLQELAPVLGAKDVHEAFNIQSGGLDESGIIIKENPEYVYGFFLNPNKNSKKVKINLKFKPKFSVINLYGVNRTLALDAGDTFLDTFEPYSVHIYEVAK